MTAIKPSYLRYLTKFGKETLNLPNFDSTCAIIVGHTLVNVNETFKRSAQRGSRETSVTLRFGVVIESQTMVTNAPLDAKEAVRDQMSFLVVEMIREELSVYEACTVESVDDFKTVTISVKW